MNEIIFGIHLIQDLLNRDPKRLQTIFFLKERNDRRFKKIITESNMQGIITKSVNRQWLNKYVKNSVHQGIVAIINSKNQVYKENDITTMLSTLKNPLFLILDGITDPYNLGACLRTADAANVNAVIIPKDRSASLNPTVKKAASGAAENIPIIRVTNLSRTLLLFKKHDISIIGTTEKSQHTLYKSILTNSMALVIGSEYQGMRRLTREYCDKLISIPMLGSVSSLNVSVAAGICLFEIVRQRQL